MADDKLYFGGIAATDGRGGSEVNINLYEEGKRVNFFADMRTLHPGDIKTISWLSHGVSEKNMRRNLE